MLLYLQYLDGDLYLLFAVEWMCPLPYAQISISRMIFPGPFLETRVTVFINSLFIAIENLNRIISSTYL